MRGLCISFISSCFLFPVEEGSKKLEDWVGVKNFRTEEGYQFGVGQGLLLLGGVSTPLHAMPPPPPPPFYKEGD